LPVAQNVSPTTRSRIAIASSVGDESDLLHAYILLLLQWGPKHSNGIWRRFLSGLRSARLSSTMWFNFESVRNRLAWQVIVFSSSEDHAYD
jgi:hypothetical protein